MTYTEPDQAITWLWRWVDGAKTAGELYGRVLVVFAAQHHAHQTCLPQAQRRPSVLPSSHGDRAKKAFAKLTKGVLPGTHRELIRAIERATRDHERHLTELRTTAQTNEPTSRPDPSDDARQTDDDRDDTAE